VPDDDREECGLSGFDEMNREVIAEFRAKDGVVEEAVGGYFKGKPILLLHTTGARTGSPRMNPLMFHDEGDVRYVFASKGGAPDNPAWFYNLRAHPEATVEFGRESYPVRATEITGDERDRIYAAMVTRFPQFAEYEEKTSRTIPVVALRRAG
jgi:deazaflavin-dependent oxidoreductase (nitroreductase family)